ncbi:MAG: hypothetical protein AAGG07_02650 [Planctomycetota bacterium]
MNTPCPNCSSASAVGSEMISACAECASVTVAGASLSIPGVLVAAIAAFSITLLAQSIVSALRGSASRAAA